MLSNRALAIPTICIKRSNVIGSSDSIVQQVVKQPEDVAGMVGVPTLTSCFCLLLFAW